MGRAHLTKIASGYAMDREQMTLAYDASGQYVGQWQPNFYGDGEVFLHPEIIDGRPHVNGRPMAPLTLRQMRHADGAAPDRNPAYDGPMGIFEGYGEGDAP